MKKYILVLFLFLNVSLAFADDGEPPIPGEEDCCIDLEPIPDPDTGDIDPDDQAAYDECLDALAEDPTYCDAVPIDSTILILFALGISLGGFKVYQNKKRQFEN